MQKFFAAFAVAGLLVASAASNEVGSVAPVASNSVPSGDVKQWWPRFLGPQFTGIAPDKGLNFDWKKTPPKTLWKVPLGEGFSSFCIIGDRLYTMCGRDKRDMVICLDKNTGKEIWTRDVAPTYLDKQKQGAGPRSTPTYHEGKLYCLFPMGELVCLAPEDGNVLWSANQFADTGAINPAGETLYWGATASPLIEGDLVIVQPGGNKDNSVAAFNKNTGKLVWSSGNDQNGYGSPQAVTVAGQRQLVVPTATSVLGLEPIKGKILWRYEMFPERKTICSTPVFLGDNSFWISSAYKVGCGVIEISRNGEKWAVRDKWKNTTSLLTLYSNGMVVDGHVYGCHGDLSAWMIKCVDLKTGEVKWDEPLEKREWLMAVDGHLLCWTETGILKLLELTPKDYVRKAELPKMLAPKAWAAPAMADGRLYLRDQKNALCLDLRKQ